MQASLNFFFFFSCDLKGIGNASALGIQISLMRLFPSLNPSSVLCGTNASENTKNHGWWVMNKRGEVVFRQEKRA